MKITGNTMLITGGATGIGLALARELVARNNEVIICGRREDRLETAKVQVPSLHIRVADVSDPESRAELVARVESEFPHLNVLVNNAGIQRRIDFRAGAQELVKVDEEIATLRFQLRDTAVRVFEIIPPIVTSELGAGHRPPEMNRSAMPAEQAAKDTVDALASDKFEAPIGEAAGLRAKGDAMFPIMNRA